MVAVLHHAHKSDQSVGDKAAILSQYPEQFWDVSFIHLHRSREVFRFAHSAQIIDSKYNDEFHCTTYHPLSGTSSIIFKKNLQLFSPPFCPVAYCTLVYVSCSNFRTLCIFYPSFCYGCRWSMKMMKVYLVEVIEEKVVTNSHFFLVVIAHKISAIIHHYHILFN